jgi:hypothetical protein
MNTRQETRHEAHKREAAQEEAAERKREDREAVAHAKHDALGKEAAAIDSENQAKLAGYMPSINEPPQPQAKPVITALMPAFCVIGDPDFTLFITGENFSDTSVIFFAGHDEPTTLNADGTVSTGVKPSLWGAPTTVSCRVHNGAQPSNALDFEFRAPIEADAMTVKRPAPDHERRRR